MANSWFKCNNCDYAEQRLLPNHVQVSETPCPECGGKMVRQ